MMINDTAAEKKRRLVCGAQLSSQKSSPLPTAPASHSSGACRSLSKGARTCRAAHAPRGKAVRLHAPGPSQGAPLYPWAFYRSVWRRPRPCAPGRAECRGFALSGAPPTPWRTRGTARATAAAAACRVGRCAQGAHLAALPHPRCARAVLCLLSPPPPPRVSPKLRRRTVERPPCFLDTVDQGLPRLPTIHVCPSGASPSRSSPRAPLARQRRRRLRGGGYTWSQ